MTLARTMLSINKTKSTSAGDTPIGFMQASLLIFPVTVANSLVSWLDLLGDLVRPNCLTFDLR